MKRFFGFLINLVAMLCVIFVVFVLFYNFIDIIMTRGSFLNNCSSKSNSLVAIFEQYPPTSKENFIYQMDKLEKIHCNSFPSNYSDEAMYYFLKIQVFKRINKDKDSINFYGQRFKNLICEDLVYSQNQDWERIQTDLDELCNETEELIQKIQQLEKETNTAITNLGQNLPDNVSVSYDKTQNTVKINLIVSKPENSKSQVIYSNNSKTTIENMIKRIDNFISEINKNEFRLDHKTIEFKVIGLADAKPCCENKFYIDKNTETEEVWFIENGNDEICKEISDKVENNNMLAMTRADSHADLIQKANVLFKVERYAKFYHKINASYRGVQIEANIKLPDNELESFIQLFEKIYF